MSESELNYISSVKAVIDHNNEPIETVDELAVIDRPIRDGFSLNTLTIINCIDGLVFEREDSDLDGFVGTVEERRVAEMPIASAIVAKVESVLSDIKAGNFYGRVFWIEFVYSRLKEGIYSYRSIRKAIKAITLEEANIQRDDMKAGAPLSHPTEPGFTLEDVRVGGEIVDSNGKTISC